MGVAIITDSAAALPEDLAKHYGISIVPMWVTVDGVAMHEGDVSAVDLVTRHEVRTSGPTPGEFEAAIRERRTEDGVVVCTIASTMSSTYEAAVIGARAADGSVRVVDTTTAAGAQALVVLAAARVAAAGGSLDDVEAAAHRATREARLIATVPNLDYLVRSGRVPNLAGWAGTRLGLAPLFEFRGGSAHALRPARGMPAALDRMVDHVRRDRVSGARLHAALLHAQNEGMARELLVKVREEFEPEVAFLGPFGTVMIVHTGLGVVGLAWRWESAS